MTQRGNARAIFPPLFRRARERERERERPDSCSFLDIESRATKKQTIYSFFSAKVAVEHYERNILVRRLYAKYARR